MHFVAVSRYIRQADKQIKIDLPQTQLATYCIFMTTLMDTLEYLINVYDQLSVYGGNLGLDTHRVGIQ